MKVPFYIKTEMSKLNEANKYFFGTENPKDVKKLFESSNNWKDELKNIDISSLNIPDKGIKGLKSILKYYESHKSNQKFLNKVVYSTCDDILAGMKSLEEWTIMDNYMLEDYEHFSNLKNTLAKSPTDLAEFLAYACFTHLCFINYTIPYDKTDYNIFLAAMQYIANDFDFSKILGKIKERVDEKKKSIISDKTYIYYGTEENGYEIQKYETKNVIKDLGDILADTDLSKREIMDLINEFTENINENGVYYTSTYNSHGYDIFVGVAKKSQTKTLTDILKSLRKEFKEMSGF